MKLIQLRINLKMSRSVLESTQSHFCVFSARSNDLILRYSLKELHIVHCFYRSCFPFCVKLDSSYWIFAYWCIINLKTSASQNDNTFSCKLPISQLSHILIIYRFSNFPILPAREFSKQRQLLCQLFPTLIIKYDNSSLIQLFFVSFSLGFVTFHDILVCTLKQ